MERQLKQIKIYEFDKYGNSFNVQDCVNNFIIQLYNEHGVTEPIIETNSKYITVIYNKSVDVVDKTL
jgi:hypothetical protein